MAFTMRTSTDTGFKRQDGDVNRKKPRSVMRNFPQIVRGNVLSRRKAISWCRIASAANSPRPQVVSLAFPAHRMDCGAALDLVEHSGCLAQPSASTNVPPAYPLSDGVMRLRRARFATANRRPVRAPAITARSRPVSHVRSTAPLVRHQEQRPHVRAPERAREAAAVKVDYARPLIRICSSRTC